MAPNPPCFSNGLYGVRTDNQSLFEWPAGYRSANATSASGSVPRRVFRESTLFIPVLFSWRAKRLTGHKNWIANGGRVKFSVQLRLPTPVSRALFSVFVLHHPSRRSSKFYDCAVVRQGIRLNINECSLNTFLSVDRRSSCTSRCCTLSDTNSAPIPLSTRPT